LDLVDSASQFHGMPERLAEPPSAFTACGEFVAVIVDAPPPTEVAGLIDLTTPRIRENLAKLPTWCCNVVWKAFAG
jgi:hypothetical protein